MHLTCLSGYAQHIWLYTHAKLCVRYAQIPAHTCTLITDTRVCIQVPDYSWDERASTQTHMHLIALCMPRLQKAIYAHTHTCAHWLDANGYPCIRRRKKELSLNVSWERWRNTGANDFPQYILSLSKISFFISFSVGLLIPRAKAIKTYQGYEPVTSSAETSFLSVFWDVFWSSAF